MVVEVILLKKAMDLAVVVHDLIHLMAMDMVTQMVVATPIVAAMEKVMAVTMATMAGEQVMIILQKDKL
jgi:hypothetical protein